MGAVGLQDVVELYIHKLRKKRELEVRACARAAKPQLLSPTPAVEAAEIACVLCAHWVRVAPADTPVVSYARTSRQMPLLNAVQSFGTKPTREESRSQHLLCPLPALPASSLYVQPAQLPWSSHDLAHACVLFAIVMLMWW